MGDVGRLDAASIANRAQARRFGLVVGALLLCAAGVLFVRARSGWSIGTAGATGVVLILLALVAPGVLGPVRRTWLKLGSVLGWINTRILLAGVFFLVVSPVGMVARLFGRRLLAVGLERSRRSYWHERPAPRDGGIDRRDYLRPY